MGFPILGVLLIGKTRGMPLGFDIKGPGLRASEITPNTLLLIGGWSAAKSRNEVQLPDSG